MGWISKNDDTVGLSQYDPGCGTGCETITWTVLDLGPYSQSGLGKDKRKISLGNPQIGLRLRLVFTEKLSKM